MLRDAVARDADFDAIVDSFNARVGGEARAIVQALLAARGADEEEETLMWTLERPSYTARATFTICISRVRDAALKARLEE